MDYKKIGKFIESERKALNWTPAQLAEKVFVREKVVLAWESGEKKPSMNALMELSVALGVTFRELLVGERSSTEEYEQDSDIKIFDLLKQNELRNKKLHSNTWVLAILSTLFYLTIIFVCTFMMKNHKLATIISITSTVLIICCLYFAFKLEVDVNYYECESCHQFFTPISRQAMCITNNIDARHLKCPMCGKRGIAKKILDKEEVKKEIQKEKESD